MKHILIILGTARKGRESEKVARFVLSCIQERQDVNATLIDVADYPQSFTKGLKKTKSTAWKTAIRKAHGLVIVSPEYNHGYPGELKLLLDSAYDEYAGKPVAICGVSNGPIGGARMAEQLKLVLSAFQMIIINAAVYFSMVNELFDTSGKMKNGKVWKQKVHTMLDQVLSYS